MTATAKVCLHINTGIGFSGIHPVNAGGHTPVIKFLLKTKQSSSGVCEIIKQVWIWTIVVWHYALYFYHGGNLRSIGIRSACSIPGHECGTAPSAMGKTRKIKPVIIYPV